MNHRSKYAVFLAAVGLALLAPTAPVAAAEPSDGASSSQAEILAAVSARGGELVEHAMHTGWC